MKPQRLGVAACVVSALGFGAMAIFAKEAYGAGVDVLTLLSCRFLLAALVFWAIVVARGTRLPSRRVLLSGLALGAGGYAAESGIFFASLSRIGASLAELLLYIYPMLVLVGAVLLGRERITGRRAGALGLASGGTALVLAGNSLGSVDGLGVLLAVGAAVLYAGYVLAADRLVTTVDPLVIAATVTTGAAVSVLAAGGATGGLDLSFAPIGWLWIAALAVFSSVVGITGFLVGVRLVGPGTASILSTAEPVVTVSLAAAVYGEVLSNDALLGGIVVLAAVVLLQSGGSTVADDEPAPLAARPAPARALAHQPA